MAVQPELLAGLGVALKENAPGVVLPAHKRYALSMIADGQSQRGIADGFTKAAASGVSPEAHAADNAAEQMAAKIGIQPPPEPMAMPLGAAPQNATSAGQQAYSASNPDPAGGQTAAPQPGMAAVNPGPPPGTYYDPVRKISVYDPNYHGPYTTIMSPTDVSPGAEPLASGPSAPASGATAVSGQAAGPSALGPRPPDPVYGTAQPDQTRIDHAWKMFDEAMSRMPVPPNPAEMPKIGTEQLFIMAAAGLIDPVAGAIVAKSILSAPVMAKQLTDQQREKSYGDSIRLWQNETQRTMQAATNVERSEESSARTEQSRLNKIGDAGTAVLNKWTGQVGAEERNRRTTLTRRAQNLETILTSKPLDPATRKQYTDTLNDVNAQLSSGAPLLDTNGEPTPQFLELQQKIDTAEAKQHDLEAHSKYLGARYGLTEAQTDRLYTLLPHEEEKMDSQTALNYGNRLRAVESAINMASQVDDRTFKQGLALGRFKLDVVKAQLSEVGKLLKDKITERDNLNKSADKLEASAQRFHDNNLALMKEGKEEYKQWQDMLNDANDKREAAKKMDDANGAISTLQGAHDRINDLLGSVGDENPAVPSKPTLDSLVATGGGHGPASIRYNNPGAQYPGPSARKFGSTGTKTIGGGHKIAVFADPVSGAAAQFDLLMDSRYQGKTLAQVIGTWSGGNNAKEYASSVSRSTGIPLSTKITGDLMRSEAGIALVRAMARHEAGREYPLTDEQWRQAQSMAFSVPKASRSYSKPNELGGPMRPG